MLMNENIVRNRDYLEYLLPQDSTSVGSYIKKIPMHKERRKSFIRS